MRFQVFGRLASVSGCVLACALPAVAQTTAQIPLQFDFLAPGARSMALGSAFTARADDATAAFTNPAGLVQLFEPEVSFELRYRRNETPFLAAGRISGTITGIGEDTIQGPVFGTSVDQGTVPSFASFVYARRRLAVSAYRHQLVELQNAFLYRGVFERVSFAGASTDRARDLPLGGERELAIASYGASVAYRVGRGDRISIGGGVSLNTFDLSSDFARFDFDGVFGAVNTSITTATATQRGSDTGWAVNGGVLWQVHRKVTVGSAYRRGPSFSFEQDDRRPLREPLVRTGRFKVPDVFTLGGLWRPVPTVSVSVDYARVAYLAAPAHVRRTAGGVVGTRAAAGDR